MSTLGQVDVNERTFVSLTGALRRPFSEAAKVKCRGYSAPLQRRLSDFGADESFEAAASKVKEHYGIDVSASAIRRTTLTHAEHMQRTALAEQWPSEPGVACVIAETDGCMIPTVTLAAREQGEQERDARKRRKVCWKEARLTLAHAKDSCRNRYAASTGSVDQAGKQLLGVALRAGMGQSTHVHSVGDGAKWIAEQVDLQFGAQGHFLIDFYHLCDYLAMAAPRCAEQPKAWLAEQKQHMKEGRIKAVLAALLRHIEPPGVEDEQAPVRACHRYITHRPGQFEYAATLQADLPIGSGEIESAHRHVIQKRLKLAGAWWKLDNAESMLALRTTRANGDWQAYWATREAA